MRETSHKSRKGRKGLQQHLATFFTTFLVSNLELARVSEAVHYYTVPDYSVLVVLCSRWYKVAHSPKTLSYMGQ